MGPEQFISTQSWNSERIHAMSIYCSDGRWGEATLEVCLAIVESARTHADVRLSRQTALPT